MEREINPGVTELREKGSKILTENPGFLPNLSLRKACNTIPSVRDAGDKPYVVIVNSFNTQIPGHAHLDQIAKILRQELERLGCYVEETNVPGICDGVAMGHFGMKYSLASRELIADSIESIVMAHPVDAWIGVTNCDKIDPANLMAMVRLNIPAEYLSGGPMLAGMGNSDLVSVFQAVGALKREQTTLDDVKDLADVACPTPGSCAGMYTANSMNCSVEAVGIAVPGNGTIPAYRRKEDGFYELNPDRVELTKYAARCLVENLKREQPIKPLDIITQDAIDNVFALDMAMGGSTNTVLHWLAIAYEAGIDYDLTRINEISQRTPNLSKLAPSREEVHIEHLDEVGGIGSILKELYENGLIKNTQTITGNTIYGNINDAPPPDGYVIHSASDPFSSTGGLSILYGNLAPNGSVIKTAGVSPEMMQFEGPAIIYDSQEAACDGISSGEVKDGHVVVIRYEGPRGGPGMQEMLAPTSWITGAKINAALITDGRFSGGTKGGCVGHIAPEAAAGGPIAAVQNRDIISIDIPNYRLDVKLSDEEIQKRLDALPPFEPKVKSGWLSRYADAVTSADTGAVLLNQAEMKQRLK